MASPTRVNKSLEHLERTLKDFQWDKGAMKMYDDLPSRIRHAEDFLAEEAFTTVPGEHAANAAAYKLRYETTYDGELNDYTAWFACMDQRDRTANEVNGVGDSAGEFADDDDDDDRGDSSEAVVRSLANGTKGGIDNAMLYNFRHTADLVTKRVFHAQMERMKRPDRTLPGVARDILSDLVERENRRGGPGATSKKVKTLSFDVQRAFGQSNDFKKNLALAKTWNKVFYRTGTRDPRHDHTDKTWEQADRFLDIVLGLQKGRATDNDHKNLRLQVAVANMFEVYPEGSPAQQESIMRPLTDVIDVAMGIEYQHAIFCGHTSMLPLGHGRNSPINHGEDARSALPKKLYPHSFNRGNEKFLRMVEKVADEWKELCDAFYPTTWGNILAEIEPGDVKALELEMPVVCDTQLPNCLAFIDQTVYTETQRALRGRTRYLHSLYYSNGPANLPTAERIRGAWALRNKQDEKLRERHAAVAQLHLSLAEAHSRAFDVPRKFMGGVAYTDDEAGVSTAEQDKHAKLLAHWQDQLANAEENGLEDHAELARTRVDELSAAVSRSHADEDKKLFDGAFCSNFSMVTDPFVTVVSGANEPDEDHVAHMSLLLDRATAPGGGDDQFAAAVSVAQKAAAALKLMRSCQTNDRFYQTDATRSVHEHLRELTKIAQGVLLTAERFLKQLQTARKTSAGNATLTVAFLNCGGGTNPMEFVSGGNAALDNKLKEFMTRQPSADTLVWTSMLKFTDQPWWGDLEDASSRAARFGAYLTRKRALVMTCEYDADEIAAFKRVMPLVHDVHKVSLFSLLVVADKTHDLDAENKTKKCEHRFNPFNRATSVCKADETGDSQQDDDNGQQEMRRVFSLITEGGMTPAAAFDRLAEQVVRRWENTNAEWIANAKQKWKIEPGSDQMGILMYDLYCLYFLFSVLNEGDRNKLNTHFEAYLNAGGMPADMKTLATNANVVALAENKLNMATMLKDSDFWVSNIENDDRDDDVAILSKQMITDQDMQYDTWGTKDKATNQCMSMAVRRRLSELEIFKDPIAHVVALGVAPTTPQMTDPASFAKAFDMKVKALEKVVDGVKKFIAKAQFTKLVHADNDAYAPIVVGAVHAKDYQELCEGMNTVSAVNAVMKRCTADGSTTEIKPKEKGDEVVKFKNSELVADVLMGDFNVTVSKSRSFFCAVYENLGRPRLDDTTTDNGKALTKLIGEAKKYLEKAVAGIENSARDLTDPFKFLEHVRVVPCNTVTTIKTRGFISPQPKKIADPVKETKDFVFYNADRLILETSSVVPGVKDINESGTLNTAAWPMDHAGIRASFRVLSAPHRRA